MRVLQRLWKDEAGFVVSAELILVATVVVIGLLSGLAAVRDGIVGELSDVAGAIQNVNQSYSINGMVGHSSEVAGFDFVDELDFCDSADDIADAIDNCIVVDLAPTNEGDAG